MVVNKIGSLIIKAYFVQGKSDFEFIEISSHHTLFRDSIEKVMFLKNYLCKGYTVLITFSCVSPKLASSLCELDYAFVKSSFPEFLSTLDGTRLFVGPKKSCE